MNVNHKSEKKKCYCNCDNCFINKGKLRVDETVWSRKSNKEKCCKACKLKFESLKLQKSSNETLNVEKKQIKKKPKNMIKNQKCKKVTHLESKSNMIKQIKEKSELREPWNTSTKVAKLGKPEMEEKIQKRLSTKFKKEVEKNEDSSKVEKVKHEKKLKKESNKIKSTSKEKNNLCQKNSEDREGNIYISYSVKGYLIVKPKNEVEVRKGYYDLKDKVCEGCVNGWSEEEVESNEEEFSCKYCSCCNDVQTECSSQVKEEESCQCQRRCLCMG